LTSFFTIMLRQILVVARGMKRQLCHPRRARNDASSADGKTPTR